MHTAKGYQLAPAYDLVASMTIGEHHAAGFADQPYPPTVSEAEKWAVSVKLVVRYSKRLASSSLALQSSLLAG